MGGTGKQYADSRYGTVRRQYGTGTTEKFDVATVGTVAEYFITLPRKARIVGFGIQSAASDVVFATSDTFELRTQAGAKLATLVGDGDTTVGTGDATVAAPETGTSIAANQSMRVCVGSNAGVSGSAIAFVDWVDDVDDTRAP